MKNGQAEYKNWLLKNVRLIDGSRCLDEQNVDLVVSSGKILQIAPRIPPSSVPDPTNGENLQELDCKGLWLWPGLIDGHVHFRDPGLEHKENFLSGGKAAARGGYTAVVCEPNTKPPLADTDIIEMAVEKAQKNCRIRTYFKAAMTYRRKGGRVADYETFKKWKEIVAVSDDGDPVSSMTLMDAVCRQSAACNLLLSPHCEDSPRALNDYEAGIDPGFDPLTPYRNETLYVERDAALAAKYGCKIHFSHLSLESSVDVIQRYKKMDGASKRMTCELTPHHLLLSARDYPPDSIPAVNPPLRSRNDVQALGKALCDGVIDAIASDHAPHSREEKSQGANGLIGLETTLGLILTYFVRPGLLAPVDACRLLSSAPATIFHLPGGEILEDKEADLVLIDPAKKWIVDPEKFESKSRNTPFEGRQLTGKAVGTMVGGQFVFADDDLLNRNRSS